MGWFGFGPGIPYLGWGTNNTIGNSYWEGPVYGQRLPNVNRSAEENRKDSKSLLKYILFATVAIIALITGKGILSDISNLFRRSPSSGTFQDTISLKGKSTKTALARLHQGLDSKYFQNVEKHRQTYLKTGDFTDLKKHLFDNVPNGQSNFLHRKKLKDFLPSDYDLDKLLEEGNLSKEGIKYRDLRKEFITHEQELGKQFRQDKVAGLLPASKNIDSVEKYAKYRQEALNKLPKRVNKRFKEAYTNFEYKGYLKWAYNSPQYREKFFSPGLSTLDEIKKSQTRSELLAHKKSLNDHHSSWKTEHERIAALKDDDELMVAHKEFRSDYITNIRDHWKIDTLGYNPANPQRVREFHTLAARIHEASQQNITPMFEKLLKKSPLDETPVISAFHTNTQDILSR
jgi:hypothetical protein